MWGFDGLREATCHSCLSAGGSQQLSLVQQQLLRSGTTVAYSGVNRNCCTAAECSRPIREVWFFCGAHWHSQLLLAQNILKPTCHIQTTLWCTGQWCDAVHKPAPRTVHSAADGDRSFVHSPASISLVKYLLAKTCVWLLDHGHKSTARLLQPVFVQLLKVQRQRWESLLAHVETSKDYIIIIS